jgi:phage tail P2-like protein
MSALIPDSIKSPETVIFDELFARFGEIDLIPMLVYMVDYVDASALPHLAWQFHLTDNEGWGFAKTDEERRKLIKNAIPAHKVKGKVKACKFILQTLGFVIEQQEWFDYGGDPYHFKLKVSSGSQTYSENIADQISQLINEYKNARSLLDNLELNLSSESTVPSIGGFGQTGLYITGGAD